MVMMMDAVSQRVAEKLAAFDSKQDPALLHAALEMIEAAECAAADDASARPAMLGRWLGVLAALERNIDAQWDEQQLPTSGAPLPPTHGVVYPSGETDPETIADALARASYEQALQASRDYARHYGIQFQLRRIDDDAMLAVARLLAERYSAAPADRQEFADLLAASALSEPRQARLRAFLPGAAPAR